jgi:hypothetical protein
MNFDAYSHIELGQSSQQVIASAGEPYTIKELADGTTEYEYIERIKAGNRDIQERLYIIKLKDGKVVSKQVKYGQPAPYYWDSYNMQTSQRNAPAE